MSRSERSVAGRDPAKESEAASSPSGAAGNDSDYGVKPAGPGSAGKGLLKKDEPLLISTLSRGPRAGQDVRSFDEPKWGRPEVTRISGANRLDRHGRLAECTCTSAVKEALEAVRRPAMAPEAKGP